LTIFVTRCRGMSVPKSVTGNFRLWNRQLECRVKFRSGWNCGNFALPVWLGWVTQVGCNFALPSDLVPAAARGNFALRGREGEKRRAALRFFSR